jgi:hypothetical protein
MTSKKFDDFLQSGIIKKQSPNKERALSVIDEVDTKKKFLNS